MKLTFSYILLAAVFSGVGVQAAPTPTITVTPASGTVAALPGGLVGWGFTLNYSATSDWVVLTGSEFTGSTVYGNYTDYLSSPTAPLYVAGPAPEASSITQAWSSASQLGLGAFQFNSAALPGAVIAGNIVIHYSVFSADPNNPAFDPGVDTVVADATVTDAVKAVVTPEPGPFALLCAGALGLGRSVRRKPRA